MRHGFPVFAFLSLCLALNVVATTVPRDEIIDVVNQATATLLAHKRADDSYSYPPYLGSNYISQYYIMLQWLNASQWFQTELNESRLAEVLFDQQLADGSWQAVTDLNLPTGEVDTTIFNYWALKAMGYPITHARLTAARSYILAKGGLLKATTMTRFWLALFGNVAWETVSYVPLFVFQPDWIGDIVDVQDRVSQWVYPHLLPMAYLRATRLVRPMPERFLLHELLLSAKIDANGVLPPTPKTRFNVRLPRARQNYYENALYDGNLKDVSTKELQALVDRMFKVQRPAGSFGAYTVSTLFTVVCLQTANQWTSCMAPRPDRRPAIEGIEGRRPAPLSMIGVRPSQDHPNDAQNPKPVVAHGKPLASWMAAPCPDFAHRDASYAARIEAATRGAFPFIEGLYLKSGPSAYLQGVLDYGDYWDSMLAGLALMDVAADPNRVLPTANYLASRLGWAGLDWMDGFAAVGDCVGRYLSAQVMAIPSHWPAGPLRQGLLGWLQAMQNDDGGWGAFNRNRQGWWLVKEVAAQFADSAELFDPSTVDVTAHIMEAFASVGQTAANSKSVQRAVAYLRTQQQKNGMYPGRWGIGYVYGTGAALVGLRKAEVPSADPACLRAAQWLLDVQNHDGGWGETSYSYKDPARAGKGLSTVSQTAWALLGLLELRDDAALPADVHGPLAAAIERGVGYLVADFRAQGGFNDRSAVGTGHPGIIYMQYPVYAQTWPLMLLGRYLARSQ
ncbi:putative squalene-tetrahymanol cyclase [Paratrimastix pyriformis]|uniref:Squalene-tetrahymanol cyclase n=1 Tax=Paratrimastix pyriformis TaxID=342808 RepID=A0ABQ8UHK5_9EUKA|nr:putative squalene-tetrahymanol cyclase [Paratrimastix pyriformis]